MRTQPTVEGIERDGRRGFGNEARTPLEETESVSGPGTATVEEGVRVESVRWSVIVAGVFAAVACLTLLGLLAAALGLPPFLPEELRAGTTERPTDAVPFVVAAIVAILGFGFGGWVASRLSVLHTARTSLLCGALVWAVAAPLLVAGASARRFISPVGPETAAGAPIQGAVPRLHVDDPLAQLRAREIALGDAMQRTSGVAFLALVLALGASLAGGYLGQGSIRVRADIGSRRTPLTH